MDAISLALRAEFWKSHLLRPETPRKGDMAVVVRDHHATETGAFMRVLDDPVLGTVYCCDCGQRIDDWVVEVVALDDLGRPPPDDAFVFAFPHNWLRRVLPIGHPDAAPRALLLTPSLKG